MSDQPRRRRPNIVFTIADDQRFSAVGARGIDPVTTPNLDALMRRGTTLTEAHIMGSTAPAVCAPSRGMLHSGRGLFDLPPMFEGKKDRGEPLPDLLGKELRNVGYRSHIVGKWHNGKRAVPECFDSGEKLFFHPLYKHHAQTLVHDFDPTGQFPDEKAYIGDDYSTPMFADAAADFINRYDGDGPFFLYVGFTAPHDPRTPRPEFAKQYGADSVELPPNYLSEHPFNNGELDVRDEKLAPRPRTEDRTRQELADYYAMCSDLDDGIGRIHRALREAGLEEDTIVIHTADHGLAVGQHGLLGKQNLYDHSVRVPLTVAGPGIPQGVQRPGLCYMQGLMPTVLEWAGAPVPESVAWRSLDPLIQGEADAGEDCIFSAYRWFQRMVRCGRHKLIEYYPATADRRTQLFDIEADPWEMQNLADDPAHAELVAQLRVLLREQQGRWNDPHIQAPEPTA